MRTEEKGKMIGAIITELHCSGNAFDEGDTFFSLCFKSDKELRHIAKCLRIGSGK